MASAAIIAIHQKRRSALVASQLETLDDDVLCQPEERRRSGRMEKKMVASKAQAQPGTDGITWRPRFAVLSDEKLAFVKTEGETGIIDFIPLAEVEAVSMQQIDKDEGHAPVSPMQRTGSKALSRVGSKPQLHSGGQGSFKGSSKDQGEMTQEYHLIIQTVADGFNSGRRYVHRVPPEDAEVCRVR